MRQHVFRLRKTAKYLVIAPEAPAGDAAKGQVLHRIAQMRELPVEHGGKTLRRDQQVAHAKIAMAQARLYRIGQRALEPAESERVDGRHSAQIAPARFEIGQHLGRAAIGQ